MTALKKVLLSDPKFREFSFGRNVRERIETIERDWDEYWDKFLQEVGYTQLDGGYVEDLIEHLFERFLKDIHIHERGLAPWTVEKMVFTLGRSGLFRSRNQHYFCLLLDRLPGEREFRASGILHLERESSNKIEAYWQHDLHARKLLQSTYFEHSVIPKRGQNVGMLAREYRAFGWFESSFNTVRRVTFLFQDEHDALFMKTCL